MQWFKDKVSGGGSNEGPDKQNFMIGSHNWTGNAHSSGAGSNSSDPAPSPLAAPVAPQGSFRNPESAQNAVQAVDSQSNPYVQPWAGQNDSSAPAFESQSNPYVQHSLGRKDLSASKRGTEETSKSGLYPKIFESSEQGARNGGSEAEEEEILTGAQVLLSIPGAIVHLIDEEESVHLATGDFTVVRLFQDKTKVVVIAKVGPELQWPLVQEEPTVKLDPTHYFFTLKVPTEIVDNNDSSFFKSEKNSSGSGDPAGRVDTLNYGVTFPGGSAGDHHLDKIRELDYFLERYTLFSAPTIVQGEGSRDVSKQAEALEKLPPQDPNFPGKIVSEETVSSEGKAVVNEETSQAFWTTMAPNVDDYNHKMTKGIAIGAGHIIRGIFWLSDSTVEKLDSGQVYMTSKFKPKDKKTKISPLTVGSVRSVRRLSAMTDKVVAGVLGGIVYTTGLLSSAVVNSAPGRVFFRTLPGEVALVSLDAFGRVFDAIEKAGSDVLVRSSSVTQEFVNYRYGESAKELTDESLRTVGHVTATAWTLTKIRKALNPTKLKVSKVGIAKSLAKSTAEMTKKT